MYSGWMFRRLVKKSLNRETFSPQKLTCTTETVTQTNIQRAEKDSISRKQT